MDLSSQLVVNETSTREGKGKGLFISFVTHYPIEKCQALTRFYIIISILTISVTETIYPGFVLEYKTINKMFISVFCLITDVDWV